MSITFTPRINGTYKISDNLIEVMGKNQGKTFRKIIIDTTISNLELSYLIKVLNNSGECICNNYEDALYINELINKGLLKVATITLEDDLEMKDRSYIDFSLFKNTILKIPSSYYMWGAININDSKTNINQKSIDEVTRIVKMISEFPEKLTDVEKIILVTNYIQQYCEYINSKTDEIHRTGEQFELIDDKTDDRDVIKKLCHNNYNQVGYYIEEPLFENYATCTGFAELIVLLLNNPYINIRAEVISGEGHSWNAVLLGDKYYNLDITRSIVYSPYRAKNNLRTLKYNKEYILVGTDFLEQDGHEKRVKNLATNHKESKEDFSHEYIDAAIEHLINTELVQFEYQKDSFYHRESSAIKK